MTMTQATNALTVPDSPATAAGQTEQPDLHQLTDDLALLRQEVLIGPGEDATERQHARGRLTARERIDRLCDAGSFREIEIVPPAPGVRIRAGRAAAAYRRCDHGIRDGRRAEGVSVRARLPDLRRLAGRGPRAEDPQDHGPGGVGGRAAHRPERRRRRPDTGGRHRACRVRRDIPAERAGLRRHPADQRDARAVRGRGVLFTRADRFRVHGPRDLQHVPHRAGCDPRGDRRGGQPGRPGRCRRALQHLRPGHLRARRRGKLLRGHPGAALAAAAEQS